MNFGSFPYGFRRPYIFSNFNVSFDVLKSSSLPKSVLQVSSFSYYQNNCWPLLWISNLLSSGIRLENHDISYCGHFNTLLFTITCNTLMVGSVSFVSLYTISSSMISLLQIILSIIKEWISLATLHHRTENIRRRVDWKIPSPPERYLRLHYASARSISSFIILDVILIDLKYLFIYKYIHYDSTKTVWPSEGKCTPHTSFKPVGNVFC